MHELSIALSIIDIAKSEAHKADGHYVKEVELEIGSLAGIEIESLEFSFSAVQREKGMEETVFVIQRIKAQSECKDCHLVFDAEHLFELCPNCKGFNTYLVQGNELKVKSILID